MKKIWYWVIGIALFFIIFGAFIPEKEISEESTEEIIETLTISCNGPAGESFYLFTSKDDYEITSEKVTCKKPIKILERACVSDIDEYTLEMDKVRQGELVGWAMRKDLICSTINCNSALDSICNERG